MLSSNDIDVEKYFWSSPVAQLSLSHPVAWGMGGVWAYSGAHNWFYRLRSKMHAK